MNTIPYLLVVEDDPDDQYLLQDALVETCFKDIYTHFVHDGQALTQTLEERADNRLALPSLILLDLNLPRKNGREALKEIRSNSRLANVPVVILTNSLNQDDMDYCMRMGIDGFYHKPNTYQELRDIINILCEKFLMERRGYS